MTVNTISVVKDRKIILNRLNNLPPVLSLTFLYNLMAAEYSTQSKRRLHYHSIDQSDNSNTLDQGKQVAQLDAPTNY